MTSVALANFHQAIRNRLKFQIDNPRGEYSDDGVPLTKDWPKHELDRLMSFHKAHAERFKLFTWLYANGVRPDVCSELTCYWMNHYRGPEFEAWTPKIVADINEMVRCANAEVGTREHFRMVHLRQYVVGLGRPVGYATWDEYVEAFGPPVLSRQTGFPSHMEHFRYYH
jgi:hypothetical protein